MAAGTDERYPVWVRMRTDDVETDAARHLLADGRQADWASYGRYCALRLRLSRSPGSVVDLGDEPMVRALARELCLSPRALRAWLDGLAACGGIDAEAWAEGRVLVYDIWQQGERYRERVELNRKKKWARKDRGGEET